jgi:hypothetical protein
MLAWQSEYLDNSRNVAVARKAQNRCRRVSGGYNASFEGEGGDSAMAMNMGGGSGMQSLDQLVDGSIIHASSELLELRILRP